MRALEIKKISGCYKERVLKIISWDNKYNFLL